MSDMHHHLKEHTTDCSLVSAYDIQYKTLTEPDIYCSDYLFIDSGGYEVGTNGDLSEAHYTPPPQDKEWSQLLHLKVIQSLQPRSRLIIVNYDEHLPYDDQIRNAKGFFETLPMYASDFLVKPQRRQEGLNIEDLIRHTSELAGFSILGVTEKELGESFLERCENIVRLRKSLHDHSASTPIHIFGSLDPLSVLAYFLCGADIFDGLSWLRYAYRDGVAVYHNSYALMEEQWSTDFDSLKMTTSLYNLGHLRRMQASMRHFAQSYDWNVFKIHPEYLNHIINLVGAAGVKFGGG